MPTLLYLSLMRFPNEKAHSLQIMQNCEAFANEGYTVELWVTRRFNTPDMKAIKDPFAYYGVEKNFVIRRVPVIDLMPLCGGNLALERWAFLLAKLSYVFFLLWGLLFKRADLYYTRDEIIAWVVGRVKRPKQLAYEAHLFGDGGVFLQRQACEVSHAIIAITPPLAQALITHRGAHPQKVLVAHDGIRGARFENLPTQAQARQRIGWQEGAFVVGFVGRLQMLNMDKGVGTLIHALSQVEGAHLAIVGGPDDIAENYRQLWQSLGMDERRFLYVGHVVPAEVPAYISAFSVCAMPHPNTAQYANYTSPLKLFEYMACGKPIIASDLPSWQDVLQDGYNALLVPPDDVNALASGLVRLHDVPELAQNLGAQAYRNAWERYTWQARARHILLHLSEA